MSASLIVGGVASKAALDDATDGAVWLVAGPQIFSPVETEEPERREPWEVCMRVCVAAARRSDLVAVLPGWAKSPSHA